MRKSLVLTALAGLLLATAAFAQNPMVTTYTQTVYPHFSGATGYNWISLKGVPIEPDPLGNIDWDNGVALTQGVLWQGGIDDTLGLIDYALFKLDPTTGNTNPYDSGDPTGFGKMLLGEGYMLVVNTGQQHSISYQGIADGVPSDPANLEGTRTDMWISLPGKTGQEGGIHWVGNPHARNVMWNTIKVTDGTKTIPIWDEDELTEDAVSLGWIEDKWPYLDGASQSTYMVDPYEETGAPYLEAGLMYRVVTHKANIALIIPAPPTE